MPALSCRAISTDFVGAVSESSAFGLYGAGKNGWVGLSRRRERVGQPLIAETNLRLSGPATIRCPTKP
jgi:hypothetical protein